MRSQVRLRWALYAPSVKFGDQFFIVETLPLVRERRSKWLVKVRVWFRSVYWLRIWRITYFLGIWRITSLGSEESLIQCACNSCPSRVSNTDAYGCYYAFTMMVEGKRKLAQGCCKCGFYLCYVLSSGGKGERPYAEAAEGLESWYGYNFGVIWLHLLIIWKCTRNHACPVHEYKCIYITCAACSPCGGNCTYLASNNRTASFNSCWLMEYGHACFGPDMFS